MVSREILNSHSTATLRAEIKKANINLKAGMSKSDIIDEMMKQSSKFDHIKMKEGKAKKEKPPPKPKAPPKPVNVEAPVKVEATPKPKGKPKASLSQSEMLKWVDSQPQIEDDETTDEMADEDTGLEYHERYKACDFDSKRSFPGVCKLDTKNSTSKDYLFFYLNGDLGGNKRDSVLKPGSRFLKGVNSRGWRLETNDKGKPEKWSDRYVLRSISSVAKSESVGKRAKELMKQSLAKRKSK